MSNTFRVYGRVAREMAKRHGLTLHTPEDAEAYLDLGFVWLSKVSEIRAELAS